MPKLTKRPPKYAKFKNYAVTFHNGKRIYLGIHDTPESWAAYHRFCAEIKANPGFSPSKDEKNITVRELTAAFLDYAKVNKDPTNYGHYRVVVLDFLDKLYGADTSVEDFTPRCLKLVRNEMVQSRRFCRRTVNDYTFRIIAIFAWGVENDLVPETTWRALKVVKTLKKGSPGTVIFDPK